MPALDYAKYSKALDQSLEGLAEAKVAALDDAALQHP